MHATGVKIPLGINGWRLIIKRIDLILNVIHDGERDGLRMAWMTWMKGQMIPFLDFTHGIEFYEHFNFDTTLFLNFRVKKWLSVIYEL